jgi:hypothetical protein
MGHAIAYWLRRIVVKALCYKQEGRDLRPDEVTF